MYQLIAAVHKIKNTWIYSIKSTARNSEHDMEKDKT